MKIKNDAGRLYLAVHAGLLSICATTAHAGEVSLAGLATDPNPQQFIVHLRDGIAETAAAHSDSVAMVQALLEGAKGSMWTARGAGPAMQAVRELAVGPVVVRAQRALDSAEAEQWMRLLAVNPQVALVEVDRVLTAALDPDDPRIREQWGFASSAVSLNVRPA